jgi:hypothetical protein
MTAMSTAPNTAIALRLYAPFHWRGVGERSATGGKRMLRIVLSGGQTGVDQAAFRAAQASELLCAGWCPPDRSCETGAIPASFPVQSTPYERSEDRPDVPRSLRTEWNVRDSDGTLIIHMVSDGPTSPVDRGTDWTEDAAKRHKRPLYVVEVTSATMVEAELEKVGAWMRKEGIRVLNIAGPSDRTAPAAGDWSYQFLLRLFKAVRAEGGAPNGGPATPMDNSGVTEGPPSVS